MARKRVSRAFNHFYISNQANHKMFFFYQMKRLKNYKNYKRAIYNSSKNNNNNFYKISNYIDISITNLVMGVQKFY